MKITTTVEVDEQQVVSAMTKEAIVAFTNQYGALTAFWLATLQGKLNEPEYKQK